MNNKETKQCPFCYEEIIAFANKCKYCNSDLREAHEKAGEFYGNLMLAIPFIYLALSLIWIKYMNISQNPNFFLKGLGYLFTLTISIIAAIEAKKLGIGNNSDINKHGKKRSGPVAWFIFIFLLWIIGYPAYLYHRSKYGLKNRLSAGILVTIIIVINEILLYFFPPWK